MRSLIGSTLQGKTAIVFGLSVVASFVLAVGCTGSETSGDSPITTTGTFTDGQPAATSPAAPAAAATSTSQPASNTTASQTEDDSAEKPINFAGSMKVEPSKGRIGSSAVVSGSGLPANTELELVWSTVDGEWDIRGNYNEEYHGRVFTDRRVTVATVRTDSGGVFQYEFTVPDDFGFTHNLTLESETEVLNRAGFWIEPEATIEPSEGPLGTPITITMKGVGYSYLENSFMMTYDNRFTGVLTSVTTRGTATAVIPATGGPGKHIIRILHGAFNYPYLNGQQNPHPDQPVLTLEFPVTDGAPVLPPPAEDQGLEVVMAGPAPSNSGTPFLWLDTVSGPIDTPVELAGGGFEPGEEVEFLWYRVVGNRISGSSWDETSLSLGKVSADAVGNVRLDFTTLDDLGGPHRIEAVTANGIAATTKFLITPSANPLPVFSGEVGTTLTFNLKGVGWTETANIYHVVYDNGYLGYACGFNSQGDVTVFLPLTGQPGWHYVDLYPGIYKGNEAKGVQNFRIPQLTFAEDHPGETLPAFHFAVYVES